MITTKRKLQKLFSNKGIGKNYIYSAKNILNGKKIIVYGAGNGFIALNNTILSRYNFIPHLILDNKFNNNDIFYGINACSLSEYQPTKSEKKECIVIVTVGDITVYNNVRNNMLDMGFKTIIRSCDIFEFNIHHMPADLKKKGQKFYLDQQEKIETAFDLMMDSDSKEVYYNLIKMYFSNKPIPIPHRSEVEQNYPADIKLNKGYSRWINCGSYDGDTLDQIIPKVGKIDALACFEPDLANFALLSKYLIKNKELISEQIIAYPCGVFNKEVQLSFSGDKMLCSSLFDDGDQVIQCVSLDNTLLNFNPTFINMDIEGAEIDAIFGAKRLIEENKPDLAISVYHFPNHLWDIPILIDNLNSDYKLYLRNYSGFSYETLLYATID